MFHNLGDKPLEPSQILAQQSQSVTANPADCSRSMAQGSHFDARPLKGTGAGVAQLVSAQLSEQEVPSLILRDFNVCFNFRFDLCSYSFNYP